MSTPAQAGLPRGANVWTLAIGERAGYKTRYSVLCIIDHLSRLPLALEIQEAFRGHDVIRTLDRLARKGGVPDALIVDSATLCAYPALTGWALSHGTQLMRPSSHTPSSKGMTEQFLRSNAAGLSLPGQAKKSRSSE